MESQAGGQIDLLIDRLGRVQEIENIADRLRRVEAEIEKIKNPPLTKWLSPAEIQRRSDGKYSASQVRRQIQTAIDYPADSPLRIGVHFTLEHHDRRRTVLIDYPEYDRLMVAQMKAVV